MGYGVPAAVAAKLLHPERDVVAIAGDGDFLMTGQELATAVQYDAPIVVLIVNNGMFGTIRMHQERHYPGRVSGTDLVNPDFGALAQAFGAHGTVVERTEDFAAAFDAALGAGRPAVIELRVDPEALTPRQSLTEIREQAIARLSTLVGSHLPLRTPTREGALPMAKSYASTVIKASPDEVWAHVRDFNGLATWHSGLVSQSEIEDGKAGDQVGSIRSFTLTDGTHIREQLLAHSDSRSLLHLRLPEDAVRRRQLLRHPPGHAAHRRRRQLRRVVDDVRLRPRPAGVLGGLLRHGGVPGRLRRAEGALRLMGGARRELRVAGQAEPISHFTDAVEAGGFLFVSGIVPVDERRELVGGDDVVAQARCVFENMRAVLAAGGCTFADVVKVTVYLTDVNDRPLVNPVRQEVFGETRPASTLVEISALVIPGAKIEVECVALVPA